MKLPRCERHKTSLMISQVMAWYPQVATHGPLTRYTKLRVAHAPECRERFPRHSRQRKPLVSDPGMHHGTCVTHVPWCMLGSSTSGGRENVPGIPGACATRNLTYLVRGPLHEPLVTDFREASGKLPWRHWWPTSLIRPRCVNVMAFYLKPKADLTYNGPSETNLGEFQSYLSHLHLWKCIWKCCLRN